MQTQAPPSLRCSKRRRAAVSYVEPDLNDDVLFDSEQQEQGDDENNDDEFGKRQKKRKRAAQPKKQKQQKPFPFQSLPAELRNTIYAMVLTDPRGGVHLIAKSKSHRRIAKHCGPFMIDRPYSSNPLWIAPDGAKWDYSGDYRLSPALLATSKAIYAETAPMLYGQRFIADDGFALMAFLMLLSPERTALLRRVAMNDWVDTRSHSSTNLPAVALLRETAPHIEAFEIRTEMVNRFLSHCYRDRSPIAPVVRLARKIYRDCHPFLYAVMRARGFNAVLEVVQLAEEVWVSLTNGAQRRHQMEMDPPADGEVQRYKGLYADELRRLMTG
ncbi:hypothetical protein PG996_011329 [Apiospora saccharicola]|uniref:DUF7730 domain-containing protein n=1 Tax=Apiospora saccharicola TaxID=335842 RepID=A0ABR1UEQ8_9PEZI